MDPQQVRWFVNDAEAAQGSAAFEYIPQSAGNYAVCAQIGKNAAAKTEPVIIRAGSKPPELQSYVLTDDFEEYGGSGTVLNGANKGVWSSVINNSDEWVEIAQDPDAANPNNKAAQFRYGGTVTRYPRLEKGSVDVLAGKPYVIFGSLYLKTPSSQFICETRGSSRKELFKFESKGVVVVNNEKIPVEETAWKSGGRIWFAAYITPNETPENSTIRLMLSGNVTGNRVIERTVNLSGVGLGSGKIVYYNTALTANQGDAIYLNRARIYYPDTAELVVSDQPVAGSKQFELLLNHDIDPSTVLDKGSVRVTDDAGSAVSVKGVEFEAIALDWLLVALDKPILAEKEYTVAFAQNVRNLDGLPIAGTTKFSAKAIAENYEVTKSYFTAAGTEVSQIPKGTASVTANVEVLCLGLTASKRFVIYVAEYGQDGRLVQVWRETMMVPAGDGNVTLNSEITNLKAKQGGKIKLMVLESDENIKPLTDSCLITVTE